MFEGGDEPRLTTSQVKAVLTTRERALTLWDDGYKIHPTTKLGIFSVVAPEKVSKKSGEVTQETYTVDAVASTCNCPQFANCGECKHLIATKARVEEAVALLTPLRNDDEVSDGCVGFEPLPETPLNVYARRGEFPDTLHNTTHPTQEQEEKENKENPSTYGVPYRQCRGCGRSVQGVCSWCAAEALLKANPTLSPVLPAQPVRLNARADFG